MLESLTSAGMVALRIIGVLLVVIFVVSLLDRHPRK